MAAAISWSYDLLEDDERAVLRWLAMLNGPFDLTTAESLILSADPATWAVADVIGRLVDRSMLSREQAGSGGRYRMLMTVRTFVRENSAGTVDLDDAHARWCWRLAVGRRGTARSG